MATKAIARRRPRMMFVRSRSRSRSKTTIPLAIVAGLVPLAIDVATAVKDFGPAAGADHLSLCTTGITTKSFGNLEWHPGYASKTLWIPLLAGVAIHKFAGMTGINRAIAKAGIPLLRI